MAYTDFYHWWDRSPTKFGIAIASQNTEEITGLTSRQYFKRMFATGPNQIAPFQGWEEEEGNSPYTFPIPEGNGSEWGLPWYYNYKHDYEPGWRNDTYKTSLYMPMLFDVAVYNRGDSNNFDSFYPMLKKYPKKLVMLGNEPEEWEQGFSIPGNFFNTMKILINECSPELQWIGPNNNWTVKGRNWIQSYIYLARTMDYKYLPYGKHNPYLPSIWGIHIYEPGTAEDLRGDYYTYKDFLRLNGYINDPIRITEVCSPTTGNIHKQLTFMAKLNQIAQEDGRFGGFNWFVNYYQEKKWDCALQQPDKVDDVVTPVPILKTLGNQFMTYMRANKYYMPKNTPGGVPQIWQYM